MLELFVSLIFFSFVGAPSFANDINLLSRNEILALPKVEADQYAWEQNQEFCEEYARTKNNMVIKNPDNLTDAEFCVVQSYTGVRFKQINPLLWKEQENRPVLDGSDWLFVRILDEALTRIQSQGRMIVYRGTEKKLIDLKNPGQLVRLKAYTSTSRNKEVALGFAKDRVMVIAALSTKSIASYTTSKLEDEVLMPRNSLLRFDKSEMKTIKFRNEAGTTNKKVEVVYLTELPSR